MPEITLTRAEALTDRLLAAQADRITDEIARLRSGHEADVSEFVRLIGERAGVEIPDGARRAERDGAIVLTWPDPPRAKPEQPAPEATPTPAPAAEPSA